MGKMRPKKWCFVPKCTNTSNRTPLKIFLTVPVSWKRRDKWFAASGRNAKDVSPTSALYCCEDHFDLENDMENYMEYKLSRVKARMKPNVAPHIFACQSERDLSLTEPPRQMNERNARRRETLATEGVLQEDPPGPSTSTDVRQVCEIACQTSPIHFESKFVQTTLKFKETDTAVCLLYKIP